MNPDPMHSPSKRAWRRAKAGLKAVRRQRVFNLVLTSVSRRVLRLLQRRSRFLETYVPKVGLVEARLPGGGTLRLWSDGDDAVTNTVFWNGWYGEEAEALPLFLRYSRSAKVILDIGAHVGLYSLVAAHANPSARVVAFEPYKPAFERLLHNVQLNKVTNVTCIDLALGERTGEALLFHVPEGTPLGLPSSSSLSPSFGSQLPAATSSRVHLTTVDALAESEGWEVDLVKIDTESTEADVIRGMRATIDKWRPVIFCEVLAGSSDAEVITGLLAPLGYQFYLLTDRGPERRATVKPDSRWRNYIFACEKFPSEEELWRRVGEETGA